MKSAKNIHRQILTPAQGRNALFLSLSLAMVSLLKGGNSLTLKLPKFGSSDIKLPP